MRTHKIEAPDFSNKFLFVCQRFCSTFVARIALITYLEDCEGYRRQRTQVGELGNLEHVDAPNINVVQITAELFLVRGVHPVLWHLGGHGGQAVRVVERLIPNTLDGAHHSSSLRPASIHPFLHHLRSHPGFDITLLILI